MKTRSILQGLLLLALGTVGSLARASNDNFNVLVNQRNSVGSLSPSDVKRILSGGTKVWSGNVVVQLGVIPGDAPETQYLASLMDTTPRELLNLIQQQVFKGELRRPTILRSSADCVAFASASPGAICVAAKSTPVAPTARVVPIK